MNISASMMIVGILCIFLLITSFFAAAFNAAEQKECILAKHHTLLEVVLVPFYYAAKIGCELTEPRFNLDVDRDL